MALYDGAYLEGPKFAHGVVDRLPPSKTEVKFLLKDVVTESSKNMTFLEGFLRCRSQVVAGRPLGELDVLLVDEPSNKALFK